MPDLPEVLVSDDDFRVIADRVAPERKIADARGPAMEYAGVLLRPRSEAGHIAKAELEALTRLNVSPETIEAIRVAREAKVTR